MQSLLAKFEEDGCLTLGQLVGPETITAARVEYERQWQALAAAEERPGKNVGDGRRMLPLRLQGALLDAAIIANPLIAIVLRGALGPDHLIDSVTCVTALPGAGDQRLHADHPTLFDDQPDIRTGCYAITLALPMIDLTPETGTTELLAGSHRAGEPGRPERPYVQAGSGYLIDYRLMHRGLANASAAPRPILYIVYARPWFTDCVNFKRWPKLNVERDALQALRPSERRLFRRLAAHGAFDCSEEAMLGEGGQ